jgi:hypothetical protein
MIKLINTGFTLQSLFNDSCDSIVVPISMMSSFLVTKEQKPVDLEFLDYKMNLDYHTSAILASLVDCFTLPWRQKSQDTKLSGIYETLNMYKHKVIIYGLKNKFSHILLIFLFRSVD